MNKDSEIRVPEIGDYKNVPVIEIHVTPGDAILAEDYSYVTAEGEVRDKVTQIASLTSGQMQIMSAGSEEVAIRWIGDDALMIGRFPARVRSGGRTIEINERYSALWSREDGRWRIRHEHASLIPDPR